MHVRPVAQMNACSTGDQEFTALVRHHSLVEIDHEILSMVTLSLLLIQEGELLVTCRRLVTRLVGLSLPRKKCGEVNQPP